MFLIQDIMGNFYIPFIPQIMATSKFLSLGPSKILRFWALPKFLKVWALFKLLRFYFMRWNFFIGSSQILEGLGPSKIPKILGPSRISKILDPSQIPKILGPSRIPKILGPSRIPKILDPSQIPKTLDQGCGSAFIFLLIRNSLFLMRIRIQL